MWVLGALNVLLLAWLAFTWQASSSPAEIARSLVPAQETWSLRTFEERVRQGSVVLLVEHHIQDGTVHAIVKEQLKRRAGTAFNFVPGSQFGPLTRKAETGTRYGDGALVLLVGSPAEFRESISIHDGTLSIESPASGGFKDLPLSEVRRIVQRAS